MNAEVQRNKNIYSDRVTLDFSYFQQSYPLVYKYFIEHLVQTVDKTI